MAEIKNELLKNCKGRIGDFVIYSCRGKTCIRRLPDKDTIKMSIPMLEQQERVASIATFYRALKAVGMHRIWQNAAKDLNMSGYNLLLKTNLRAFSGKGNICDYQKLVLSTGSLQLPNAMSMAKQRDGELVLTWENDAKPYPNVNADDRLVVAVMKQEKSFAVKIPEIGDWQRKNCRATIRLPTELAAYTHLFCYFCSAKGGMYSESRHYLIT